MQILLLALFVAAALFAQTPSKEARQAYEQAAQAGRKRRSDEALKGYQKALALEPAYAEAWCALGKLQAERQDYAAARRSFESAIRANPNYADCYLPLTMLQHSVSDWKGLLETTGALLKLAPAEFPQAHLMHAAANFNLRNLEAAEKSALAAERLDPLREFPQTWHLLGLILEQRRDFQGAARNFRAYLEVASNAWDADAVRARLSALETTIHAGPPKSGADFSVDSTLVLVRFRVAPRRGEFISDLRPEDIQMLEDGIPQKPALFEGGRFYPRWTPIEVTLLFDCSDSVVSAGLLEPRVYNENFLDEYENASIAIYGFSRDLVCLTKPTRHTPTLKSSMDAVLTVPPGDTPLFESIAGTVREAVRTGGNAVRLPLVFSDGESTRPGDQGRAFEALRVAQGSGVSVYPVMLANSSSSITYRAPPPIPSPRYIGYRREMLASAQDFMGLGHATGGRAFSVGAHNRDSLARLLKAIAGEVRYDYVSGYYPVPSGERKRRNVEVVLRSKDRGRVIAGTRTVVY